MILLFINPTRNALGRFHEALETFLENVRDFYLNFQKWPWKINALGLFLEALKTFFRKMC